MMNPVVYAANHKDEGIRKICSSGAVFIELARLIVHQGGVVFGAKFDGNWNVVHGYAETEDEAFKFVGSKYVQSHIGNEFSAAKEFLDGGRIVLFSGTPCQIEGLRSFLGKEYDNLILMDFVCHGVPSPQVWKEYLKMTAHNRQITAINFRDKTDGWHNFSLKIDFSDGTSYKRVEKEDLFMRGFLQNVFLRPSCYNCQFKGVKRNSDITIADFWGVRNVAPELYDDKGTSMIIIQSNKGENFWSEVQNLFDICSVDTDVVEKYNSSAISSPEKTEKREQFFANDMIDFKLLEKITRDPLLKRTKNFLKKNIGRV